MELQFLKREEIDASKWDEIVRNNSAISHSNYSWFLDTICKNWGAFKAVDQEIYFPIPFLKGVANKMLYHPIFSRELCVIKKSDVSDIEFTKALVSKIKSTFKHFHFKSDFEIPGFSSEKIFQKIIEFDSYEDLKSRYSNNSKRILKKFESDHYEILVNSNISESVRLMKKELGTKIKELESEEFNILESLINKSLKNGSGHIVSLCNNPDIKATAFFIIKNEKLIFIKGASKKEEMKLGAMYFLFDHAFKIFHDKFKEVDFDGSNIENVANFYRKLGGKDYFYFENKNIDSIPINYKLINKLF
jgi:hypothetical protein